jgi:hypothetical protein
MAWHKKIEVGGTAKPSSAYVTDPFDGGKDLNYMVEFDYDWWGDSSRINILHIDLIDDNASKKVIETKNIECTPDSSAKKYKVFFTFPESSYYVLKFRVTCASGTKCNVFGGVYAN